MADRPKHLADSSLQTAGTNSFGMYRVPQISTNDTCTLNDYTTVSSVNVYNADTGASMTATISTNVITLTQAAITNNAAVIFAVGVR